MKLERTRIRNFLISCSIFLCFFLLTILADRVAGFFLSRADQVSQGIIYPPNSKQYYQTSEFAFTAHINSLGFRDREFNNPTETVTRIVVIGDSFTFGWGVELAQSWTKLLEGNLRSKGYPLEIANLGKHGASPNTYADIAEKAVPLLKPDLVVVAVLQGDDLASLSAKFNQPAGKAERHEEQPHADRVSSLKDGLSKAAYRLYPNFLSLVRANVLDQSVRTMWTEQAHTVVGELTPEEKSRLDNLDPHVRDSFYGGEINPALVQMALKFPDFFSEDFDNGKPEVRALVSEMAGHLARIKAVANANYSRVVVISVPYRIYASPRDSENIRRLGVYLPPEVTVSTSADEAIKAACKQAGLDFFEVTGSFRAKAYESSLFFELDGHFNEAGNRVFADLVTPIIEHEIAER